MTTDLVTEWRWSLTAADSSPATIRDHTGFARRFLAWLESEGVDLEDATRRHAEEWLTGLCSATQRRKGVFGIKSFNRWLIEEDLAPDFASRLKTPKVNVTPQRVVTEEEITALLDACTGRDFLDLRDRALVAVLASTGCRRSEFERMVVADLNLEGAIITIPIAKAGEGRVVFLDPTSVVAVRRYMRARANHAHAGSPALWISRTGPLLADGLMQMLQRRSRQARITPVSPHMFRRGYAHRWYLNGGSTAGLMASAVNDGPLLTPGRRSTFDPLARGRGHVGSSVGTLPRSRSLSR
jgi:integrase/recombinase XerD